MNELIQGLARCTNWISTSIGEQVTLQRGFDITVKEQRPGKIPVISSGGVSSYHDKAAVSGPGVVIGRKGTLGTVFYLDTDFWPHDTTLWVRDFHGNDPKFVFYFFKNLDVIHLNVGSANPTLNRNHVHPIQTFWPPHPEQCAIAHILATLDDKIELNRRINETLEAIARAIFKSWFVDFDPVRAKAEGREPVGMDAETAALFPDCLEETELGMVPKGWKVKLLGQITCYINRGIQPKYIDNGGIKVINQKCIRDRQIDWTKARRHDSDFRPINSGRELQKGDLLINSTGVGTLGRVAQILCLYEKAMVDSHVTIVRADPEIVTWNVLGLTLFIQEAEIEDLGEGTTGQTELSRERLKSIKVLVPSYSAQKSFDRVTLPLRYLIRSNGIQIQALSDLRDALLPKLLSGEVWIKVAGE